MEPVTPLALSSPLSWPGSAATRLPGSTRSESGCISLMVLLLRIPYVFAWQIKLEVFSSPSILWLDHY